MKDTIIKGEGTSRRLRAPETMPETYSEWRQQAIDGDATFDIVLDEDGVDVLGTPLNKSTLLSEGTKEFLELPQDDPTIDNALYGLKDYADGKLSVHVEETGDIEVYKSALGAWAYSNFSYIDNNPRFAYGNGVLVAVCNAPFDGSMSTARELSAFYSEDNGFSWERVPLSGFASSSSTYYGVAVNDVCYGNGRFVAVGWRNTGSSSYSAVASVSLDGKSWVTVTSGLPTNTYWARVLFVNSLFVAISTTGTTMNSPDGMTWTSGNATGISTTSVSSIDWAVNDDGNCALVAFVNTISKTTNGRTWTSYQMPSSVWGICYGNGVFLANVYQSSGVNIIQRSIDGSQWETICTLDNANYLHGDIVYSNGYYILQSTYLTGQNPRISTNGTEWSELDLKSISDTYYNEMRGSGFAANGYIFWCSYTSSTLMNGYMWRIAIKEKKYALKQNGEDSTKDVRASILQYPSRVANAVLEIAIANNTLANTFSMEMAADQEARLCMLELGI